MKKIIKSIFKYIIIPLFSIMLVAFLVLIGYRWYITNQVKQENKITSHNGIESFEKVKIGGIDQWIYTRGENKIKPLLLFLHGGPGAPEMPFAKRKYQGKLEKEFVIVHWDQRGAGKSFSSDIPEKSININQFVADTAELTKVLLKRFNRSKLYLVGHSWGSIIGLLSAQKHPELYFAYIGIGQVVNMLKGEAISYKYALEKARKSGNKKAISELEKIGAPPYKNPFMDIGVQRKWLGEFGGMIFGESSPINLMVWEYFTFPEYDIYDLFYRFPRGFYFTMTNLIEELSKLNLMDNISEIKIPIYFCTGKHDYNVPFELTEKLYKHLKAPIKKLIWFEKSAHSPNLEEVDKFYDVMINLVLRETYEK